MNRILAPHNYHSPVNDREWLSASQLIAWRNCEAHAAAKFLQNWQAPVAASLSLQTGRYLAARWAGDDCFRDFVAESPEIFRKDGALRTEFSLCEEMYARTISDPFFRRYLNGRHWEILSGELFGVPWKTRLEVFNPEENFVSDLMVCRDFEPVWMPRTAARVSFYVARNAYLRLGLHRLAVEQATGRRPDIFLAAVTRQSPPDLKIVSFNNPAAELRIAAELEVVAGQVERIVAVRNGELAPARCGFCEYCRATRLLEGCEDAA